MVTKHIKKAGKNYKKTFTRTKLEHEPEDHHIASVIFLLGLIIILLCGVIYFLIQESNDQQELIEELVFNNPSGNDFSYYRYSLDEFERVANKPITTVNEMQQYLMDEDFDEINLENGAVSGEKGGGCYEDKYRSGTVCRTLIISYAPEQGPFVEMTVVRQLLN